MTALITVKDIAKFIPVNEEVTVSKMMVRVYGGTPPDDKGDYYRGMRYRLNYMSKKGLLTRLTNLAFKGNPQVYTMNEVQQKKALEHVEWGKLVEKDTPKFDFTSQRIV